MNSVNHASSRHATWLGLPDTLEDSMNGHAYSRRPDPVSVRRLRMEDIEAFVRDELMNPLRTIPVVALTTRAGQEQPPLSPEWLASQLGARARVVVIPTGQATYRLKEALPPRFDVYGGATRIWWPGLSPDHDPYDHPLRFMITDEDVLRVAGVILDLLGVEASVPPPSGAAPASLATLKQAQARIGELEAECRELAQEREELLKRVSQLKEELSDARQEKQALRKKLRAAGGKSEGPEDDPTSSPAAFQSAICDAYTSLYRGADAQRYPMQMIRVRPRFLESVRELQTVPVARIVEVCAHVAAARAHEIPGLDVHPLRDGEKGGAPQRIRARDGAQAWRCALKKGAPSAGRLHWWLLQGVDGGAIEFASVGVHDDVDIPE